MGGYFVETLAASAPGFPCRPILARPLSFNGQVRVEYSNQQITSIMDFKLVVHAPYVRMNRMSRNPSLRGNRRFLQTVENALDDLSLAWGEAQGLGDTAPLRTGEQTPMFSTSFESDIRPRWSQLLCLMHRYLTARGMRRPNATGVALQSVQPRIPRVRSGRPAKPDRLTRTESRFSLRE